MSDADTGHYSLLELLAIAYLLDQITEEGQGGKKMYSDI